VAIKSGGKIVFVRLADIDWIEAADNYVNLHVGQECHLLRETMNGLEARLSCTRFVRISRSAMVNIEHIKELQPMFHGEYVVVLRNGRRLTLTRGYRERLREISLL
jgi:two-component system LytT family response regulator